MEKKNITAEMNTFFEFICQGILDIDAAAIRLDVKVEDINEAYNAWLAVDNGEKPSRKGIICIGKISNAMKKLL